uniref:beta strand repeat-containing protein n=1 Tax=Polaromonas sp. YR568 TaxID=1855301 RepID=UPI00313806A2
ITTGNLTGTVGADTITLTGAQLDAILAGAGTINLGAGTGDTLNLTSTSADLNTLGATDASIQGVEAISAATAAAGVTITLTNQTEAFTVTGSGSADTITGGTAADSISAGAGNDTIVGAANDTLLDGGADVDTLNIGAAFTATGDAQIANIENIVLTAAATVNLANQTEAFTVTGSGGVDTITGGAGADSISAGAGNDTIVGAANDTLLDGGADVDTLNIGANFTATGDAQIANIENVVLTAAATVDLSNQTEAFTVTGSGSGDTITGGTGADSISAGAGNDTIVGAADDTLLDGGADVDTLNIGVNFTATSNAQIANIENIVLTAAATVNLANQTEAFTVTGSGGADTITGGTGADSISAGAGNDTIVGAANDTLLDGGADVDTLNIGANFTATGDAQIANVENILLTAAATVNLANQTEAFTVTGSGGADTITGGTGADTIDGGAGNDTIVGAANDTLLDGGADVDTLNIGANFTATGDAQIANIENIVLTAAATVNLANQTEAFTVTGSGGADTITGGAGADSISAGAGNDTIVGAVEDTLLDGGADVDTLNVGANFVATSDAQIANIENIVLTAAATVDLSNQTEAFTVTGSTGVDKILGGAGADTLLGGDGADILAGGAGNDTLTGGAGADQFRMTDLSGNDRIVDYVDGTDKIAFLDNGGTTLGSVNFANTTGSLAGTALAAADFVTSASISAMANNTDNKVVVITASLTTAQITTQATGGNSRLNDYVFVFNSTTGRGEIWFDDDWKNTANRTQIATLDNITSLAQLTAITAADIVVYNNPTDPIILDLGETGFSFNPIGNGVSFDLNADGIQDQTAWTTGTDGILVIDLDGSGIIEDGSEMFTPWYANGNYASGVAAMATLDSNADGVLSSEDDNFHKLQVWLDADQDGVSDMGELVSLTDVGIASLNLHTIVSGGEIDGQLVMSEGAFTYIDGGTGMYAEIGFDATLSTTDTAEADDSNAIVVEPGGNTYIGTTAADVFEWHLNDGSTAGSPVVDTLLDFGIAARSEGGDVLDLRDLLLGESAAVDQDNLANFLHFEKSGSDTIVHISSTGGFASDSHEVGAPSAAVLGAADQRIVLAGVDMIGMNTTDQQVIQDMLNKGKLNTD